MAQFKRIRFLLLIEVKFYTFIRLLDKYTELKVYNYKLIIPLPIMVTHKKITYKKL